MALRITRTAGSVFYGGFDLDPFNPAETCDHRYWVRSIRDSKGLKGALINIRDKHGFEEFAVTLDDPEIKVIADVTVELVSLRPKYAEAAPLCMHCGRGHVYSDRQIPAADFAIHATESYRVVRDNANKRKKET